MAKTSTETVTVTAKIKIFPDDKQKALFNKTMQSYLGACNYVSGYIFNTHDLNRESIHKAIYHEIRDRFGLKSQMACSVFKTVIAKYESIFENQQKQHKSEKWIRPRFKKPEYEIVWNRDYSLNKNRFSVGTLEGRVKVQYQSKAMEKYFDMKKYSFGTAKLKLIKDRYYLLIPVTFAVEECKPEDIVNIVGIDRGINFVVATYDSKHKAGFVSGKAIKQKRAKYAALRKELQKCRTASSRRRLNAIGQRENRWMQDVNHCVSKALVLDNPKHTLFVLEDLSGIREATERVRRKDRYVQVSWAFLDLENKLKYKAKRYGSMVINVSPEYTSQRCPRCDYPDRGNRDRKHHMFTCKKCGYKSNDDRVGAMNLYNLGLVYLEKYRRGSDTVTTG